MGAVAHVGGEVVNIDEIKQRRGELREQIYQLITQFERSTGCEVVDIDLQRYQQLGVPSYPVVRLHVVLP